MLSYAKKYVKMMALFAVMVIFAIFTIQDINKMQKYQNNRKTEEFENSIEIQNAYIEVSKKIENNVLQKEEKEEEIEKTTNINIYSTNKWRIKIPKIDLDAPIAEGTSQEALRRTVGHFEDTDKWKGNVALAGHNRGYRCNFFQDIKKLQNGDEIIYSTEKGIRKYKVVINTVIKENDWSYIKNTKDNRLTLITCEKGKKEYRRCIQAVEMKINKK